MVDTVHASVNPNNDAGKQGTGLGDREFGIVFFRFFVQGVQDGFFSGHPVENVKGRLAGLEEAFCRIRRVGRSARLSTYVARIADTPSLGK
jgi:hypothetical protein